jgi:UDP-N-acetylmuramate dehydrogenase
MVIRERIALASMTTLQVGGEARFFVDAESEETAVSALEWAEEHGVRAVILGGGSNVLVSDRGVDGLVVRVRVRGTREVTHEDSAKIALEVGAGEELDAIVAESVAAGHAGLECLSGIPGFVGATPIQNVGAYGQEIAETVVGVRALHRATRKVTVLDNRACGFSYRSSVFKEDQREAFVVLSVTLALARGGEPTLRYPELARELAARGADASSLADVRATVLAIRRSKSMVIDPSDPNRCSAGSFFVNPIVTKEHARQIEEMLGDAGAKMPRFASGQNVKLSAAWLIEHAGISKGSSDGPVGISTRHALAIVNRGGATAAQILAFAARVRDAVRAHFGVALVPEPVLVGFTPEEASLLD